MIPYPTKELSAPAYNNGMMTVPTVLEGALGTEFPTRTPTEGGAFEAWLDLVGGEAPANLPPTEEEPAPKQEPNRFLLALGLPCLPPEGILLPVPNHQETPIQHPVLRGIETSKQGSTSIYSLPPSEGALENLPYLVGEANPLQTAPIREPQQGASPFNLLPSEPPDWATENPPNPITDLSVLTTPEDADSFELPKLVPRDREERPASMRMFLGEATNPEARRGFLPNSQDTLFAPSFAVRTLQQGNEGFPVAEGGASGEGELSFRSASEGTEARPDTPSGIAPSSAFGVQERIPSSSTASEGAGVQEVATPPLMEQVAQFLEQMILEPDRNRVHLQLNPPELGSLEIQIQVEGSEVQAWVHAEHDFTRRVLEQSLQQLRDQLASRGLQLSGFSIATGNPRSGAYPFKPNRVAFSSDIWNSSRHATESVPLYGQWSVWA